MYVVRVQRCGLRGALLAGLDGLKDSFPPKERAFPPWWPFWSFRTVHNPTVVIPFSHSVDGVNSPVRDHGGLTRVPLRTHLHCYPGRCVSKRVDGHHAHARETGSVVGQMHPIWTLSGPGSDGDGRRIAPLTQLSPIRTQKRLRPRVRARSLTGLM
jgi:hypothetical protein